MQLHELKPKTKRATKKVVGRGGKRGKTSGRGTKGQKARAGHRIRPAIRDVIKKFPRLRGTGASVNRFKTEFKNSVILNISLLNTKFNTGESINPKILLDKGLIHKSGGMVPAVKILAHGVLDKKFEISGCTVSVAAKVAIEKAGGTVKI